MSVRIAVLGLLVGTLVGLSGVGAGVLTAPALILLGIHPSIAIGTDLAYSSVTKLVGTARNLSAGLIRRPWMLWMAAGSIPGTAAGTGLVALLPAASVQGFLNDALAVVLIAASGAIVAKELVRRHGPPVRWDLAERRPGLVAGPSAPP